MYAKSHAAYYDNGETTFNLSLIPLCGDMELTVMALTIIITVINNSNNLDFSFTRQDVVQLKYTNYINRSAIADLCYSHDLDIEVLTH